MLLDKIAFIGYRVLVLPDGSNGSLNNLVNCISLQTKYKRIFYIYSCQQPSSSKLFGIPNYANTDSVRSPQVTNDSTWVREVETYQSLPLGLLEKATMVHDNPDPTIRSSKLVKLNDGKATSFSTVDVKVSTSVSGSSQVFGTSANQIPKAEEASSSINQTSQVS